MREKTNASDPQGRTRACERGEDLIAYLYGEAAPAEAQDFRLHLNACAACREELSSFGRVREGLSLWRAEVFDAAPSLDVGGAFAEAGAAPRQSSAPRARSARAALREFFSLAPLWLRAGAFASVVAVCALAAFAFARAELRWDSGGVAFTTGAKERVVTKDERKEERAAAPELFTREQVDDIVRQRVADELAAAESLLKKQQGQPAAVNAAVAVPRRASQRAEEVATQNAPRRKRNAPRDAGRLRQETDDEEAALPRLSDLLNGVY